MGASLVRTGSERWLGVLERARHDFYHLPEYVATSAKKDGGEPCAVVVEEGDLELLLPLVLLPLDHGLTDATSPYGYPGPVVTGNADAAWMARAFGAAKQLLAEAGVVTLFVRFHPLLNQRPPDGAGTVVQHGDTVTVDLTLSPEEQLQSIRRSHRQQIRQALAAGYQVHVDEGLGHYEVFQRLYRGTMERVGADAYYHFDQGYFEDLRQVLGTRLHLACATIDDEVAATGLFVETEGLVQMHLTGHDERFARDQPMKLVFDQVRSWSGEQGATALHLGGGRGGANDSLLYFKAGFSRVRQPFYTLRCVVRPDEYERRVRLLAGGPPPDDTGPFPAYRRGLVDQDVSANPL